MTNVSPTGEPAAPDHVGLALRAIAAGVLAGVGATALALFVVRGLQAQAPVPSTPVTTGLIPNLILAGWLGGACIAALLAGWVMKPIASSYRRGGFAMVAAFAALALALVTMPADAMFGRSGLLTLGAAGLAGGAALAWRSRRRAR
ncbi:MAG: hypothetical protein OEW17_01720 [Gemmatimonadota bacterium]|nr:hypothetical protein [Gemmatimonadota bacterium]MDH4347499.1 hypothetical protein [Gemmatimonadota bacterium]MDH5282478.1 hypothetical protein [Gemmatimonadota bacterium]